MDCPVCQVPMVVIEYNNIELDYCVDCLGVWFDSDEIGLLLESISENTNTSFSSIEFQSPHEPVTEAIRRCPLCDKPMTKVSPTHRSVVLDRCPQGDGVWFDSKEVAQTLTGSAGSFEAKKAIQQPIDTILGEILPFFLRVF